MSRLRVAVLGTGTLGRFRASVLAAHPHVAWVGIGSASAERAAGAARDVGAVAAGTHAELLEQGVDAVVIATESADHARHVGACLERGIPMLCEKPLATTLEHSETLAAAAEQAAVTLQIGFQRRFDKGFRVAREQIATGELGTLYSLRLASHDHEPPPERFAATSGGMFRDLHVHDFDLVRWLTGEEVDEVYAVAALRTGISFFEEINDVDTTAIVLRTRGGVPVLISGTRHDPTGHDVRGEVYGSRNSLVIGLDKRTPLTIAEDGGQNLRQGTYVNFLDRFKPAFIEETNAFVDVVLGKRDNPCPGREAVEAIRIAVAAEQSQRERRPIRLEPATATTTG